MLFRSAKVNDTLLSSSDYCANLSLNFVLSFIAAFREQIGQILDKALEFGPRTNASANLELKKIKERLMQKVRDGLQPCRSPQSQAEVLEEHFASIAEEVVTLVGDGDAKVNALAKVKADLIEEVAALCRTAKAEGRRQKMCPNDYGKLK